MSLDLRFTVLFKGIKLKTKQLSTLYFPDKSDQRLVDNPLREYI